MSNNCILQRPGSLWIRGTSVPFFYFAGLLSLNRNYPNLQKPLPELAKAQGISEDQLQRRLEAGRHKLYDTRKKRIHPFKDDKILTDWNGLMIAALAKAGQALDRKPYTTAASRAAEFIRQNLADGDCRPLKRYREGKPGIRNLCQRWN